MGAPGTIRGFRAQVWSYVPQWMQRRVNALFGAKFIYVIALFLDIMLEVMIQGVRAWFPGLGTPSALAALGFARGIFRGESETDAAYEQRLIAWLTTWAEAGSTEIVAQEIQAFLGNTPTVRIVNRAGFWVTLNPDGSFTFTQPGAAAWTWDWDSKATDGPIRATWWSDLWIIVYPTEWPITGPTLASLNAIWGQNPATQGTGHDVPVSSNDTIRAIIAQWKGAHTWIEAILWSYDATLFNPASAAPGNPDGTWENWAKTDPRGNMIVARTGASDGRVRYWIPPSG